MSRPNFGESGVAWETERQVVKFSIHLTPKVAAELRAEMQNLHDRGLLGDSAEKLFGALLLLDGL